MQDFQGIRYLQQGAGDPVIVWAHGWGQSHAAFLPLAESLNTIGTHVLVDLPGFGASAAPDDVWGTEDYADRMAKLISAVTDAPIIWVGHSFGCRVGLQLAAKYPDLVSKLCLVAGAGLPRKKPFLTKVYFKTRIAVYKSLKRLIPIGLSEDWLRSKFGSADYNAAGAMRGILVKTVNEDLSETAARVACHTLLIYGQNDTETPPEIGTRLAKLIPAAELVVLDGQDHYSVLAQGRHPVAHLIKRFITDT